METREKDEKQLLDFAVNLSELLKLFNQFDIEGRTTLTMPEKIGLIKLIETLESNYKVIYAGIPEEEYYTSESYVMLASIKNEVLQIQVSNE